MGRSTVRPSTDGPHPAGMPRNLPFSSAHILDPRHFAEAIVREILSLPFFDGLQNETSDEFGRVTLAVIGRRSAASRIPHPVLAEICRSDKRVDLTDDDAVLFQLGACR